MFFKIIQLIIIVFLIYTSVHNSITINKLEKQLQIEKTINNKFIDIINVLSFNQKKIINEQEFMIKIFINIKNIKEDEEKRIKKIESSSKNFRIYLSEKYRRKHDEQNNNR